LWVIQKKVERNKPLPVIAHTNEAKQSGKTASPDCFARDEENA
jgi:hypothetical protein